MGLTTDAFRAARKSLGHTQHTLAEALFMGKWGFQTIGKWERGEREIPDRIAKAIAYLLEQAK